MNLILNTILNLLVLFFSLTSCSSSSHNSDVIVIGTSADNPPYEYLEKDQIVGIDIEVAKYIGKSLGKKIEIKNIDFSGLIPALKVGDIDMVIAGLDKTPERSQQINFSDTYYSTQMALVCHQQEIVSNMSDINGKKIGVQSGSTWEIFAQGLSKQYSIYVRSLNNNLSLISEIKSRNIDCGIFEDIQAKIYTKQNLELAYFIIPNTKGNFAIGLPKSSKLLKDINKAIAKMTQEKQVENMVKNIIEQTKQ